MKPLPDEDRRPVVRLGDLEEALAWTSSGDGDHEALLSVETGQVHWLGGDLEETEALPDDIEDGERYVQVPDQHSLDLGRPLVDRFVRKHLPAHAETVSAMFRRKGAWREFKFFLQREELISAWHEFENAAIRQALREWAESEGFRVSD